MRVQSLIAGLALVLTGACAAPVTMISSKSVPGATGSVKASEGQNGTTQFQIDVEHLAPPDKVAERSSAYVVWVQVPDHTTPPANVGTLKVNEDLTGSFQSLTALKTFDVLVTPEIAPETATPSGAPVLTARIDTAK